MKTTEIKKLTTSSKHPSWFNKVEVTITVPC